MGTVNVGFAKIEDVLVIPRDLKLDLDFRFWKGSGKSQPALLSAASANLVRRGVSNPTPIAWTTGDGQLEIDGHTVLVRVPLGEVEDIAAADYDFELHVTTTDGDARKLVAVMRFA